MDERDYSAKELEDQLGVYNPEQDDIQEDTTSMEEKLKEVDNIY